MNELVFDLHLGRFSPSRIGAVLVDHLMPDDPLRCREAVQLVNRRLWLEASGGITLDTIREVAATGVNAISVGALTHSARALDLALDILSEDA